MNEICINPTEQSVLNRPSTDKFILILDLPHILRDNLHDKNQLKIDPLQISVYGTVVPQIEIPTVPVGHSAQTLNVTSLTRPNYAPLDVNFVVDGEFTNYWILWKWLYMLNHPRESGYSGKVGIEARELYKKIGQAEYQTTITVLGLNEYNKPQIQFIYYNCFITTLGGINYNYRENNIVESSFKLQYSQFDVVLLK